MLSNEVYASGTIMANEEVELRPELSGKITQLNFTEGTKVTKGQLLVKINDADLQATF
ncbi:MAG: biotin/lipoyl-binding protein [Bacteroidetes bacterium]|nr:biotin/lipoyl-binding protein [Bacteroidota bacterium]